MVITRSKNYSDLIFLIILGGMLAIAFCYHFSKGFVMPTNTYFGLASWAIAVIVFFVRADKTFLFIIALLALFMFGVINFSIFTATISGAGNENPIVNPLALLMLVIYVLLKRKSITALWKASPDEEKAKQETEVDFYYKKFNGSSAEELDNLLRYFNEYPPAARIALKRIKSERQD